MLMYSFGELLDRLIVIHNKIYHIENEIERLKLIEEDIGGLAEEEIKAIDQLLDQVVSLNETRVKIVESINELWNEKCNEAI